MSEPRSSFLFSRSIFRTLRETLLKRPFLFSRSTFQALGETLLIAGAIWLCIIIIQVRLHLKVSGPNQWESNFYINLLFLAWFLLRATFPQRFWSKDLLKRLGSTFFVIVPLEMLYVVSLYLLLSPNIALLLTKNLITVLFATNTPDRNTYQFYVMFILSIGELLFWLVIFICILSLWQFGNYRRQRSLHWFLLYEHIKILVLVVGGIGILYVALRNTPLKFDFNLLSGFFSFLTFLIIVLSPLFLLLMIILVVAAYFATRPAIKRIGELVATTNELRLGKYTVRTPVEGKDEITQLQQNFNVMADELERTIRDLQTERDHVAFLLNERRELFANVSHELRTPIATLRGYLESDLKNRTRIPESRLWEDMAVMEREVLQLQERANELFTLSKAEIEQVALQIAPCDVRHLVQALMNVYAPLAWRTGKVEMVADISDEVPMVSADESRLEQALKNIVRNALRHTPPGGVIALIITVEPKRVGISVEDTGEGIAPEELEHIWERFYQAKTTQQRGGAGIGLSLVKEWITGMGGSVAATSTPGDGSCFTLYLPRCAS
jgi:signal transduction histidine kinase